MNGYEGDRRGAEVQRLGNLGFRPALPAPARHPGGGPLPLGQHPCHDLASTPGCRPGILMDVYPGPLRTTRFAAETPMDNLLTVHT